MSSSRAKGLIILALDLCRINKMLFISLTFNGTDKYDDRCICKLLTLTKGKETRNLSAVCYIQIL